MNSIHYHSSPAKAGKGWSFDNQAALLFITQLWWQGSARVFAQTHYPPILPGMVGYLGILHPLLTLDARGSETNVKDYFVGFPIGLNLLKTKQRHGQTLNYFVAVPLPVRSGNDRPTTATIGFQFGLGF